MRSQTSQSLVSGVNAVTTDSRLGSADQYQRLDADIQLLYHIDIHNNWQLSPSIGLGLNLSSAQKGHFFDVEGNLLDLSERPEYKSNTGFYVVYGFKIRRYIQKDFIIDLLPVLSGELPTDNISYKDAAPLLMPRVRERFHFEALKIYLQDNGAVKDNSEIPYLLMNDHLAVGLTLNTKNAITTITKQQLKDLVSFHPTIFILQKIVF